MSVTVPLPATLTNSPQGVGVVPPSTLGFVASP